MNQTLRALALLALGVFAAVAHTQVQVFPDKPVRLIVGGGPGSFPDQVARRMGERLSNVWGQQVVVENRTGAAGSQSMTALLQAAPDGYTLALATMSTLVFNPYLFHTLPYDPQRDLLPVGTLFSGSMMIVAHPSLSVNSLTELVALARAKPGGIDFAVPGNGSPPHVVLAMLMDATRASFSVVPYKTGSEAVVQVTGGQVPLFIDAVPVVAKLVEAGRLKALAVTGHQRMAQFSSVPTVAEQGYPDFRGEAWMGLVARTGTPDAVVNKINADLAQILNSASMQQYFETTGGRVLITTPEDFTALVRTDSERWGRVIKAIGMRLD